MSGIPVPYYTAEEYLTIERAAEFRSEFHDGVMYAMAGGSPRHSKVKTNTTVCIGMRLRGKKCQPYDSDLRVQINATGLYTYPDLSIVCGPLEFGDRHGDNLTNPRVIVEVLSPSTSEYDRGNKFWNYRKIPSLTDYLLISTEEILIEHYTRQPTGQWLLTTYEGPEAVLRIASVELEIPLSEIYADVESAPGNTS